MDIGDRIATEQKRAGLIDAALAKEIGASKKSLYNWKNGVHAIPHDKLAAMCDTFGCTVDYLLGRLPRERDAS